MLRLSALILAAIFILPSNFNTNAQTVMIQGETATIQPGTTLERTLGRGQSHSFTISLVADQYLQIEVDQHGIDVIVRAYAPDSKLLSEMDSPNGTEGPENLAIISNKDGVYRIEVAPLGQIVDVQPGRYEIKVVELRQATDQEIQSTKNEEVLKARGLSLLNEVADLASQIRSPQTRVHTQLQAAQMVWPSDEKLALKLSSDAVDGVKDFVSNLDPADPSYNQDYNVAMQLRQEVMQMLGPRDPEMALNFLQATRTLPNPNASYSWDQELQLEVQCAAQIAGKDPNRAVQIARASMKRGLSSSLLEMIDRLRAQQPELASQLAKEVTAKLMNESLLKSQDNSNLATGILRLAHAPVRNYQRSVPVAARTDVVLLSDQEYRDLFDKMLNEALSFKPSVTNPYSTERNSAQNILSYVNSMSGEKNLAGEKLAQIEKKTAELNKGPDDQSNLWQKYNEIINKSSIEVALDEVGRAPQEMRDQLFQQVAQKAVGTGDFVRAKQIIKDNISNPGQRRQALATLEQQMVYQDVSKGRIEAALKGISNLRTQRERAAMLSQVVSQIGPGLKRAQAIDFLEQARNLVGAPVKVENQEQMNALLAIAQVYSRYDLKKAFEIIEPLLDQFAELSRAAEVLNGFGQDFYEGGELQMNNGNGIAMVANQLVQSLGPLAVGNFDRAKADADRIERPEVRILAYLGIAQQTIYPQLNARRGYFGYRGN
jgi:hypothetical protein